MSRLSSILRRFARTYLVAMGGGFFIVSLIGLVENVNTMSRPADKSDIQYLRGAVTALLVSLLGLVAGVGIHKFQRWALALAIGIGIFVVSFAGPSFVSDPWEPGTFTILVPLALIAVWACLPVTWLEFRQQGAKTS
jgi:putative Mn2+ efflux pump MntP